MDNAQKTKLKSAFLALLAAFIWGVGFVAQNYNHAGTATFNAGRSIVAMLFLTTFSLIRNKGNFKLMLGEKTKKETMHLWVGGVFCGIALSFASYLQQSGLDSGADPGKAGFISAMYMIIVPILSVFVKRVPHWTLWLAAIIALCGQFLMCVSNDMTINPADFLVLGCAFMFSIQVLLVDRFSPNVDCIKLSAIQFLTVSVVSSIIALISERDKFQFIPVSLLPMIFLGLTSSGIAYTLQMFAQKGGNSTVVCVLLSLESVFGAISCAIWFRKPLSVREYLGCAVMFVAMIMTQLPIKEWIDRAKAKKTQNKPGICSNNSEGEGAQCKK